MRLGMNVVQPCITVVAHITSDVSQPAIYLTAKNGQKYLIGRVGEGLQRSMTERKFRTFKFSGVFLTGDNHWPSVSGLPGLLLSFAERGVDVSQLHTGPGSLLTRAKQVTDTWRHFKFHRSLQTQPTAAEYTDENLSIHPVVIEESTSYVIQMKPTRGKFMVEKAKALGIPSGALFGKLSSGEPVQIPGTETVINPQDVMGPSPTPSRVLVVDLPTIDHVRSALANYVDMLKQPTSCETYDLRAVYYFFQSGVDLESPEIQQLVTALGGNSTRHFISHPSTSPNFNTLNDFGEFQSIFRDEFPDHFSKLTSKPAAQALPSSLANCEIVQQLHTLSVAPADLSETNPKKRAKTLQLEQYPPSSLINRETVEPVPVVPCDQLPEAQVITLGTGASAPSKYRNVAGTLLRAPAFGGSVLFDSGEATYNFMTRLFGYEGTFQILKELRVLYISHMHADHHLGALRVIRSWLDQTISSNQFTHKLVIACPGPFINFLREWAAIDKFEAEFDEYISLLDLDTVCIGDRYTSSEHVSNQYINDVAYAIGLKVLTCTAHHNCLHSYNVSISTLDGKFKVSYSGDTKPNRFFARSIGQGSDLLIHEATHENELVETAHIKGHSTIGGALEIAKLMNAKYTVLTHISQRYPKLPTIGTGETSINENQHACFGFDGMRATLSQIKGIQQMVPRMSELLEILEAKDNDSETE